MRTQLSMALILMALLLGIVINEGLGGHAEASKHEVCYELWDRRAHYVCRRLVQPRPSMLPSLEDCRMHDGPFRDTRINAVYNPVNFTETECE
jgi:hypothetical protein